MTGIDIAVMVFMATVLVALGFLAGRVYGEAVWVQKQIDWLEELDRIVKKHLRAPTEQEWWQTWEKTLRPSRSLFKSK